MVQFENLFKPIKLGEVELKNRIVMLALTTGYVEADNTVGDRLISFFSERAKGGVGLIIVPCTPIDAASPMQPGLYHDRFIPGARRLTNEVHACGARIAAQLIAQYHWVINEGPPQVVGPSPILNQMIRCVPKALTIKEIHHLIEEYGRAGQRAREAGFDAVEVIVAGGYLLNRFLSPITNKRQDKYGGTVQNRMRIILEVIESIRKWAGRDYPIMCRINVEEGMEGGHTIEDSKEVVCALETAGIQALNVYVGWHESPVPTVQQSVPRGAFVHLAEKVKGWVNIPVITANRINDPILAENILAEGKADLVGMARALLADPELPNKAREGRVDEIVPCIACSHCLAEVIAGYRDWGKPVSTFCTVNPRAGKEAEYIIRPAERVKKVLIIGGGPAGMQAAMTAAARGHKVTLCEKGSELGGSLLTASIPPYKDEIKALVKSLVARVRKARVQIKLDTEVGTEVVEEEKPDVGVLATGAIPISPDIPGIPGANVATAEEVLTGRKEVGREVIIVGGGMVGCETAEFLVQKGKKVTIVEMLGRMANDVVGTYRPFFLARLTKSGVRMETKAKVEEITDRGVRVSRDGAVEFFGGDTVVLAVGFKSNKRLAEELKDKVVSLYLVGDCVEPRKIKEAIEEGVRVGMGI
jgi:2,4-dienoyl-CoA reductase-like NADH-dependent reductase (Old Yellow Enzyme family)/thioredoxin reductase